MPKRRFKANIRGVRTSVIHDELYWRRLGRDFKRCNYWHGSAYQTIGNTQAGGVQLLRSMIETEEVWMSCKPNTEQRRHWTRVAAMGCILTWRPAEIAHCHGGSMKLLGPEWQPGMAQKQNHWLVIPLSPELHRFGKRSLDEGSVEEWEEEWSTQIDLLKQVGEVLGYSVFERAGIDPALVK